VLENAISCEKISRIILKLRWFECLSSDENVEKLFVEFKVFILRRIFHDESILKIIPSENEDLNTLIIFNLCVIQGVR
jgi:hypothetical protein